MALKTKNLVLLTLTERLTCYELILKVEGKADRAVKKALQSLQPLLITELVNKIFKSIIADNETEFVSPVEAVKGIAKVYFTHPYASWDRGTNENHNGMIRGLIPKGHRVSKVSESTIRDINGWMNNNPRRLLNYMTPNGLFMNEQKAQN